MLSLNPKEKSYDLDKIAGVLRSPINRKIKTLVEELIIFPLICLFVKIKVKSEIDLEKLDAPVIFVGNHPNPPQDVIFLLSVLPRKIRDKLVLPGNDWMWNHGPIFLPLAWISAYISGEFPLNVYGGAVGKSLETIVDFIDDDFFLLVMPEGDTTPLGVKLGKLKFGLGEILAGTKTKIVPFFVSGELFKTFARQNNPFDVVHHFIPRGFSKVEISIGKPFTAENETPDQTMITMRKQILSLSEEKPHD